MYCFASLEKGLLCRRDMFLSWLVKSSETSGNWVAKDVCYFAFFSICSLDLSQQKHGSAMVAEDGDTSFRSDVAGFLRFHHSYAGSWSESRPRARASSTTYYHTSMYFTYFALCLSKVSKTTRSWYTPLDQTTVETQVLAILRPAKVHKQTAGHSENRRLPWWCLPLWRLTNR